MSARGCGWGYRVLEGYWRFIGVLANAEHPEHDNTHISIGGAFDPEIFDMNLANRALRGSE